jgi:hypothetical protein
MNVLLKPEFRQSLIELLINVIQVKLVLRFDTRQMDGNVQCSALR